MRCRLVFKGGFYLAFFACISAQKIQAQTLGYWAAADVYWGKDLSLSDSTHRPDFFTTTTETEKLPLIWRPPAWCWITINSGADLP